MRYEFINPEDLPNPEDMRSDTEYLTQVVSATFEVIKLKYIGTAFVKGSHSCLFTVVKDSE